MVIVREVGALQKERLTKVHLSGKYSQACDLLIFRRTHAASLTKTGDWPRRLSEGFTKPLVQGLEN